MLYEAPEAPGARRGAAGPGGRLRQQVSRCLSLNRTAQERRAFGATVEFIVEAGG